MKPLRGADDADELKAVNEPPQIQAFHGRNGQYCRPVVQVLLRFHLAIVCPPFFNYSFGHKSCPACLHFFGM